MNNDLNQVASLIRKQIRTATTGFVGREQIAELMILAAVAQEHLLIIGPPGTAKSAVVRRVASTLGGRYFEYVLGRFTEPNELFGAIDLQQLKAGRVEIDTTGMLPEAEIAFLDEIFLGSTAILNTLLGILNERTFRKGNTQKVCPLQVCVGAANALPDDQALDAFADRFLIHTFVEPVADHHLEDMLEQGWQAQHHGVITDYGMDSLIMLSEAAKVVDLSVVRPALANAIRLLRQKGLQLSDRRIVKSQRLIAAAAVLSGRLEASNADLWPLLYILPTQAAQISAREVLQDVLSHAASDHLHLAVEQAVQQPKSRESRLLEQAAHLLQDSPIERRQIEAVLREIDANFTAEQLSNHLSQIRQQLANRLNLA